MYIYGLQKTTLLDYPEELACIVFLGGCNFDCPYCHNRGLIDGSMQPVMSEKEFLQFLKERKRKIEGVVISGGEPTIHKDLPKFLNKIKEIGYDIKLDTNGSNPDMLKMVMKDGLVDYVAMDVKGIVSMYPYYTRHNAKNIDPENIRKSIDYILQDGLIDYEFRTTVVKEFHTSIDIIGIASEIRDAKLYVLQKFVKRDSVPFSLHPVNDEQMMDFKRIAEQYVQKVIFRGVE